MRTEAFILSGMACLLLGGAGNASAQREPMPDTRAPLDEVIARMDSPVFAAREQAVADLLARRDLTLQQVEALLDDPGLAPEQRLRLERVATAVFARGPRAALGIRFAPERRSGVRILEVLAGFPASGLLQPGDVFIEIDGLSITTQAACRAAILSHAPGESIRARVQRGGQEVEVVAPLGSFAGLSGAIPPNSVDLLAAWTLRRSRDGHPTGTGVIVPTPGDPPAGEPKPEPGSRAWDVAFARGDAPRGVVVGGQSRSGTDLSLAELAAMDASRQVTLEDLEDAGEADLAVQVTLLRERRDRVLEDLEHIAELIEGGNLDRNQRAMMRRRLDDLQDMLEIMEQQIRMLDEARRDRP